jgi:ABC-type bacteriocin/lantibiotic exporter with double-glycine peptidase domain
MALNTTSLKNFIEVISEEKKEIYSIYFYSAFYGLVQLSLPIGIQSIISFVLAGTISTSLVLLIMFVVIGVFISGLVQVNQMKIIEKIQQQLMVRYAFMYAHRIPKLDIKSINDYYMPELANRFFDTISLQKGISKLLLDVPAATIQIIFGLILLSIYHPVFIFFGVILLVTLFFIIRVSAAKGMITSIQESNYKYKIAGYIEEIARSIFAFKFSNNRSFHINKMDGLIKGYLESRTSHFRVLLVQYWSLIVFKVLITAAMLVVGAILLIEQQLNIGQFIAAEIVILLVIGSVEKLIVNLDKVYDVLTSIEKLNKIIDKPIEGNGTILLQTDGKGLSVDLRDVSFSYTPEKEILHKLNFSINPGEKALICGDNSSGKSTLLKLLNGSLNNVTGKIDINKNPIGQYEKNSLRNKIGVLFTRQEIFEGTLLENIAMGNPNIPIPSIVNLSEIVGLKNLLDSLPEGVNSMIMPTGNHLSDRTIKKILLLRALIHEPALLLLDEPFTGLESTTQLKIQAYLLNQMPNTTLILTANEPISQNQFQHKIVMSNGTISSHTKI